MKIVIANSIGTDKEGNYIIHSPSRWSEGVKNLENWFAYYPWELAYTSSLIKNKTEHEVKFLDGCLERLTSPDYLNKIIPEKPDYLVMESATRMIDENLQLALEVKKQLKTKLIFCGQHATAYPKELKNRGIDFVCIGEYENTVLDIVSHKDLSKIKGLYPRKRRELLDINSLPFPEDDDVSRLVYGIPGEPSSEYLEIQMYASRGCPMSCNYCVARNLYYAQPNFRSRNINNIIEEIIYLKSKYHKLEGIFFDEEIHNGNKKFTLSLCQQILNAGLADLHFEAMCAVSNLDEEMMRAMKQAGYYKLRMGIETGSKLLARNINRNLNLKNIINTLKTAQKIGLKMYGTFMFGLPYGNQKEEFKTVKLIEYLIKNQYLQNVQISLLTPQPETPFFKITEKNRYLISREYSKFDGGNSSLISYPQYSQTEIKAMFSYALSLRDHLFLINNTKYSLLPWLKKTYLKKGFLILIKKLAKRIVQEIIFLTKYRESSKLQAKKLP